jgi:carbonic anhydrase
MQRKLACSAIIFLATIAFEQQPAATAPAVTHHGHAAQPAQSPDKIWSDLMDGNKRFVAGKLKPRAVVSIRESLTNSQHPKAMVLSCSDSRVPPESVFDQTLGDFFVVRAAGARPAFA